MIPKGNILFQNIKILYQRSGIQNHHRDSINHVYLDNNQATFAPGPGAYNPKNDLSNSG